jgi:hypothetical protein
MARCNNNRTLNVSSWGQILWQQPLANAAGMHRAAGRS